MKTIGSFENSNNRSGRANLRTVHRQWRLATGIILTIMLGVSLAAAKDPPRGLDGNGGHGHKPAPQMQFAVISDIHLYNNHLGTTGVAFESYLNQDPKLLRESEAILDAALDSIIQQHVRFVIIPGDLTKDGELVNHLLMAHHLAKLEQHGIQAFVVPGNHDLNNPDAVAFSGDTTRPVPNVSPRVFRAIYERFGYGQAIDRDRSSLSYVAEPVTGLWLIGIDSTDAQQNEQLGYPVVGGKLSPSTLAWVQAKLQQAQASGKKVIAFMHHGVNPDFVSQPILFPDWLVDDWPTANMTLASSGLRVIFTGHYHAQDASYLCDQNLTPLSPLCDVETSSLAAFPCAYRIVTIQNDGNLNIESRRVTAIDADTGGVPFQDYAEADLRARLPALATAQLEYGFGVPHDQAAWLAANYVTDAIIAGYVGDEMPDIATQGALNGFVGSPEPLHSLGLLLWGMWTDPPPGDNNLLLPFTGN
jgi:hypothetical protein